MIKTSLKLRKDRLTIQGYPIILYVNINGCRMSFYTDIHVANIDWFIDHKISKKDPLYKEKNRRITEILSLTNIILLNNQDVTIVKKEIASIFNSNIISSSPTFISAIEDFIKMKSSKGTISIYQGTIHKINDFSPNIQIEEINSRWLSEFERFCAQTMCINAYSIHLRNIRAVFNYLIKEDKTTNYPFKNFKIKTEKTIHRALSLQQLKELKDIQCSDFMVEYRDIFMLMVYLIGINSKDLLYLKTENIIDGRIMYKRAKTGKLYSIKLEPEALHIINIYKGEKYLLGCLDRYKIHNDYLPTWILHQLNWVKADRNKP